MELGLAENLDAARKMVLAGKVLSEGQLISQPSQNIPVEKGLELVPDQRFVSRGGEKLQAAFDQFALDVSGLVCADVGASTGGFTDCLLQNKAARIYAIDVGYGILDWKIRNDPSVIVMERTNARKLENLPEAISFLTVDVSFISLKLILPRTAGWFNAQGGAGVVLIKPQFEATREEAAIGEGVISDPAVHRRVVEEILSFAETEGYGIRGVIRSPLVGPAGNQEFLAWLEFPRNQGSGGILLEIVEQVFK